MSSSDEVNATYVPTYHIKNILHGFPSWSYPSLYEVYCTRGYTIPGERHPLLGAFFIAQYIVCAVIYIPSLVVIGSRPLIEHSCYKLMFAIGVLDIIVGVFSTLGAGIFSVMGANYCDNTRLLTVAGHLLHSTWYAYCMSGALLAFNRCVEMRSPHLAERLFRGNRCWLWLLGPLCYGIVLSSNLDIPPIYNSVWSGFLFAIDVRGDEYLPTNWFCFVNSIWVMSALTLLYTLLMRDLRSRGRVTIQYGPGSEDAAKMDISRMQRRVLLQSIFICGFLFIVLGSYAAAAFIAFPLPMLIYATMSLQLCSGSTSIVYLALNRSIRTRVLLLLARWFPCAKRLGDVLVTSLRMRSTVAPRTNEAVQPNTTGNHGNVN